MGSAIRTSAILILACNPRHIPRPKRENSPRRKSWVVGNLSGSGEVLVCVNDTILILLAPILYVAPPTTSNSIAIQQNTTGKSVSRACFGGCDRGRRQCTSQANVSPFSQEGVSEMAVE